MPWINIGPSVQIPSIKMPPAGCFTTGYMVSKAEFQSCTVQLQVESTYSGPVPSYSLNSAELQQSLGGDWTASVSLNQSCLQQIRTSFLSSGGCPYHTVGNSILHCAGIKRKINVAEGVALTISASPDTELCFFGIQLSLSYHTGAFLYDGTQIRIEIQASLTIRFGLSAAGWRWLISKVGSRALSLVGRIPGAARLVFSAVASTPGIIVVGTVACTALLTYVMASLIAYARESGEFRGQCRAYADGYVGALAGTELGEGELIPAIDAYNIQNRNRPSMINGYVDALLDAREYGYSQTRRNLLTRIGLGGEIRAIRRQGSEFPIIITGRSPFAYRSINYLASFYAYQLIHNRTREQEHPMPYGT